jgi:hypothetical protein
VATDLTVVTGGTVQVEGGSGTSLSNSLPVSSGGVVQVQGGSGATIQQQITGGAGGRVEVRGGTTAAIFSTTDRYVTILINGIDRSEWVEIGIRRNLQIGSGSRATCQFKVNSMVTGVTWRPVEGDEVLIYEVVSGVLTRFFLGIVDSTTEWAFNGPEDRWQMEVNCVDHGCLLDNIIVHAHFEDTIEDAVLGYRLVDVGPQTDTFVATGLWPQDAGFITRYAINGAPTVTVNGNLVDVCRYDETPAGFQGFEYIPDGWGIFTWPQAWQGYTSADRSGDPRYGSPYPDTDLPLWLNAGDVIVVNYIGRELIYFQQEGRSSNAEEIVKTLIEDYLASYGIVYGGGVPAVSIGKQTFNYVTITDVFNSIAAKLNLDWRLDFFKTLWFFPKGSGYGAAPFSLATNDGKWYEMRVTKSRAQKRNRQYVRNSLDLKPLWTDTFIGDGERMVFPVYAKLNSIPRITVDTGSGEVEQTVVNFDAQTAGWQWTWKDFSVWAATPPTEGSIIRVTFPSPFSYVAVAEDAEDIARHGPIEAIEEVRDVQDLTSLQAIADGLLARRNLVPVSLAFTVYTSGLEPGQLLSVNTLRPLINGSFTIQSVSSEEQGKGRLFRHQVRASTAPQIAADEAAFLQRLHERTKQAKNTGTYTLIWHLAETVEGLTNSGLQTGYKSAILVAPKAGVIRDCTLRFQSVDGGTPTTALIEIDIEKNGVSIFGATRMQFPIGGSGTQVQYIFTTSPVVVTQGDVFRINVLQADSVAKDGVLALTVVG